jgi:hypothetical protein
MVVHTCLDRLDTSDRNSGGSGADSPARDVKVVLRAELFLSRGRAELWEEVTHCAVLMKNVFDRFEDLF